TQSESGDETEREEDLVVRGEGAEDGEQGEDRQGDAEGPLAAESVGNASPDDRADRHADEICRRDIAAGSRRQGEVERDEWSQEAVERDVPRVEQVPESADEEDLALHIPFPGKVLDDLVSSAHTYLH